MKVKNKMELMKYLIENLKKQSRNNIKTLLSKEQVTVNGKIVKQFNYLLEVGDTVEIDWNKKRDIKISKGVNIIFEDRDILVVEKESGLLSISTQKNKNERTAYKILMDYVKNKNYNERIYIVHRLDRETSGVMLFAKNEKVKQILQENWKDLVKKREYAVLVEGILKEKQGTIKSYLKENKSYITYSTVDKNGKLAITNYKVIKEKKECSFLLVSLETGRKNQIRVHMSDIGHPVLGDKKYGSKNNGLKRLGLHALNLKFIHPITKRIISFESNLPQEFKKIIEE